MHLYQPRQGIPEERQEKIFEKLDLVLLPGVAFDKNNERLGRGRGHYDKFIERMEKAKASGEFPKATLVGLAFREQVVDELPIVEYDRKVDMVISAD